MSEIVDIGDLCTHCHRDTSFGSGLFVNRIPSGTETEDGYMCPDCQMIECDRCDKSIECGEDVTVETATHPEWVHWDCLTHKEKVAIKLDSNKS